MSLRSLFPLLFVLCLLCSIQSANANTQLRVLSWNIQFGQGTDGITNFDRTAAWLARMNPDIIALCEMPPDKIPTLVNSLTQRSGRAWFTYFVPKAPGINEGNLIISAYNFSATGSKYLSYTRSIAQVTINVGGKNINFFATHLDATSSGLRQTEVQELLSWTSGFASPRIIAGDMNAANDTVEVLNLLNVYRDSWVDALNQGTALAYPDNPVWLNTRTRRWRIDFILYSSDPTVAARGSNIPDTRDLSNTQVVSLLGTPDDKGVRPSDHNLVVADFDVAGAVATATPTPAPVPVLLTQGSTDRALAIHSTQFTREPFSVTTTVNMSNDLRTRIMLFATNLDLLAGETVSVRATDSRGLAYDLAVEQVVKVPNFSWLSVVTVRLPDDQSITGDLVISLGLHGTTSNSVRVAIRAP
ncbi:MAG TPA: endonuclease/exonuclease/phosphatase family protein [Pyrinomonadaceae bacterium]|jgi:endonuclease/exonuclease/phosphatase family metal-dependent hydrolase|nr:endonuclease/exonuclease/phosphatase family protein [Pyrinomonadaceae bacterium]